MYTDVKYNELIKALKSTTEKMGEDEIFEIAGVLLQDEVGLEDYLLNIKKVSNPQERFAADL